MVNCFWAPTSRHILTVSQFNLRLTVWSLVDSSVQYIQSPKKCGNQPTQRGYAFSPNRKIFALIEKSLEDGRDMVGLYDLSASLAPASIKQAQNWRCLHQFYPDTFDAAHLMFTQEGNHLVVWESPIKTSMQVYQIVFGQDKIEDIQLVHQYSPYDSQKCLGIRALAVTPNKQYILAGYCDQRLRLINTLSWKEVFAFDHGHHFEELNDLNSQADLNIYVESDNPEDGPLYEAVSKPFKLQKLTQAQSSQIGKDGELPRVGVSQVSVSFDSQFAASVNENCPCYVWIWDLERLNLNSLIMQKNPVADVEWAPNSLNLNISSSDSKIFLWSLRGASVCQVPYMSQSENFNVLKVRWNPNGKNFAAIESTSGMVFVYPQLQFFMGDEDEEEGDPDQQQLPSGDPDPRLINFSQAPSSNGKLRGSNI
mmetsp:Transcript_13438/g.22875  ORF Transcript_13438/g.22875 Transcript_13438/m.22875 type:complete len:424 (-) Transcript_13438:21-1292(-)